jgi:hydrogenase nickel incorporation protein HypA/HybF
VLDIVERTRESAGAERVVAIELEIGQLAAVEPEALRFAMDALLVDSCASGAHIHYRFTRGRARCNRCDQTFELDFLYDCCSHCGSFDKAILEGDDMLVQSIELI